MTTLTLVNGQYHTDNDNGYDTELSTEVLVSHDFVFDTLIACKGHMPLTRELLAKEYGRPISDTVILDAIKDRLPELKQYMETLAVLELFSLMPRLSKTLEDNLNNLEGADAVSAFMDLHKLISAKVDTQKIDVTHRDEIIWRNVPLELRQLWLQEEDVS